MYCKFIFAAASVVRVYCIGCPEKVGIKVDSTYLSLKWHAAKKKLTIILELRKRRYGRNVRGIKKILLKKRIRVYSKDILITIIWIRLIISRKKWLGIIVIIISVYRVLFHFIWLKFKNLLIYIRLERQIKFIRL